MFSLGAEDVNNHILIEMQMRRDALQWEESKLFTLHRDPGRRLNVLLL